MRGTHTRLQKETRFLTNKLTTILNRLSEYMVSDNNNADEFKEILDAYWWAAYPKLEECVPE